MTGESKKGNANGWRLFHGIHRGTITSRDTRSKDGLASLEECKQELAKHEAFYRSIGYVIWFATAYSPEGVAHKIHPGNAHYAR